MPDRKVLCCGDLFIWASPNCGNPQKVQRYPKEWAVALRAMAGLGAEMLLPGHGLPIVGADRIRQALTETRRRCSSHLHDQTVAMMNEGARLDEIVHTVDGADRPAREAVPAAGLRRARVRRAQHVAALRRLVRRQPGHAQARARGRRSPPSVAALAGGAGRLWRPGRRELADAGDLRLAGHLAEWAALAAPDDAEVQRARAEVNRGAGEVRGVHDVEGRVLLGRGRVDREARRAAPTPG